MQTRMICAAALLIYLSASVAMAETLRPSTVVDRETVAALSTRYTFGATEAPLVVCTVRLKTDRAQTASRFGRLVSINRRCRDRFPQLRQVSRWERTGGGSIRLLGGAKFRELADFAPVQDTTGVYLRGAFAGDGTVYEMRPPQ